MASDTREQDLNQAKGALEVLFTLREEFAQWLEETEEGGGQREALENVLSHVESLEEEYERRRAELEKG